MNKFKMLIVDDETEVLKSIERLIKQCKFLVELHLESSSKLAISRLKNEKYDLLIVDQKMPEFSGLHVIDSARKYQDEIDIVLMSGYSEFDVIVNAINNGHISGFIMKPWKADDFDKIIDKSIRYKSEKDFLKLVRNQYFQDINEWKNIVKTFSKEIMDTTRKDIKALALLIRSKDSELYNHSLRISQLATEMGHMFNLSDQQIAQLQMGSLMHDLGKVVIKDQIHYKPSKLSDDEFIQMKKHPLYGAEVLKALEVDESVVDIVLHHHERVGGGGYPDGLKNDSISLLVKIVSIADAYDAMTSERVYKPCLSSKDAIEVIREQVNIIYDLNVFLKLETLVNHKYHN